ncbi:hypothetical protein GCM10025858_35640 [Alicyclobacillus sacchari]|nr:hypothetical protein GCM10025858_35640 [Alicyclobacillus sacchari]
MGIAMAIATVVVSVAKARVKADLATAAAVTTDVSAARAKLGRQAVRAKLGRQAVRVVVSAVKAVVDRAVGGQQLLQSLRLKPSRLLQAACAKIRIRKTAKDSHDTRNLMRPNCSVPSAVPMARGRRSRCRPR